MPVSALPSTTGVGELGWASYQSKKALVNIAKAGFFSSDRTIAEYNNDIWHL